MKKKKYLSFPLFAEIGIIIHFTNLTSKIQVLTNKKKKIFSQTKCAISYCEEG